ncbi:hypothetical protein DSM104299_04378 [Baekduia alba]|uniref:hypothetical protein n=1 Tax=Baekduia alba TaxID=2997333 RepID=UPI0023422A85|nr:hypothetical protein [Baekduia alba]WCB95629.1 hypothetical protein DSM104299_04378 [Baekduia alba]
MRKVSLVVAALAAMLCLTAVALAGTNQYSVTGKIASGGTKSKPKEVGVQFNYTIKADDGTLTNPVKTYKIHFQGLKSSPKYVANGKYCSAATINKASSDSGCSSKTHVGTGEVKAFVGAAGQAIDPGNKCNLKLDIYAGSAKSLALYLHGQSPDCIAPISQAIDAKLTTDSTGGALTFTVPPVLLHPVTGLDSGITQVTSTIKKIGKGKKALFYSDGTGCKSGSKRQVEVTFTDEGGTASKTSAAAGNC